MTPLNRRRQQLSAIIGMLSAIDRNNCPSSIGTAVRLRRNPQELDKLHEDLVMLGSRVATINRQVIEFRAICDGFEKPPAAPSQQQGGDAANPAERSPPSNPQAD
jgi:hypothetical protein